MLFSLTALLLQVPLLAASNAEVQAPAPRTEALRAGFWWEDYDGDGLPDAFTVTSQGAARLLHNQGDGTFADVTLISGLDALSSASFASWYDFDRDGAPDLFVGTQAGAGRLLRNAHDGTFQDVTEFVGLGHAGRALEAQWLDYDRDGLSDFALRTDAGEELYHALPSGMFEAVDLGLARSLADVPVGLSDIEDLDAAARESTDTDTPVKSTPTKHRRPSLTGVAPPFTPSSTAPLPPAWSTSGVPNANLAACVDLIKNQATATCIQVSSTPTLGWLYPLTTNLNVSVAGNVGIGTTSPTFKLDVAGTARMTDTLTLNPSSDQALNVSTGSIYKGGALFIHTKGIQNNTGLGLSALRSVTTGIRNTAVGDRALYSNTTGHSNTASGNASLFYNTSGIHNTANGNLALATNTIGQSSTASGSLALYKNTSGSSNTASGYAALRDNTTGGFNTANGAEVLKANTTGYGNTASGSKALVSNTTGSYNTASGNGALYSNTTGYLNTASGNVALSSNTTGVFNTASGALALRANTTGRYNSASGAAALLSNTAGNDNTASGYAALLSNTTGRSNTASGAGALKTNTTGYFNTADGTAALASNTTAGFNTASGYAALKNNSTGSANTASGFGALVRNTTGYDNTASGYHALAFNTTGSRNTASGLGALYSNTTGYRNIAVGRYAGFNLTTGSFNIDIGNDGVAAESGATRVGKAGNQTRAFIAGIRGVTTGIANGIPVLVDSNGQLGTVSSSRRFKEDIRDMGDATARLLALRPVTFHYKQKQTMPDGSEVPPEYGLIAEEVAEIFPDLVVYDDEGKPFTVKYHILSSMLLNEIKKMDERFKAHDEAEAHKLEELQSEVARLRALETRLAALESRTSAAASSTASLADGK